MGQSDKEEIKSRIINGMQKAGIPSIRDLAIKSNVPYTSLQSWFKRGKGLPDAEVLRRVAAVLGVSINHIIDGSPADPHTPMGVPILDRWSDGGPLSVQEEYAPMRAVDGGKAFVLKEGGMAPRFMPGDYISFVPGSKYQAGDLVVATDQFGDFFVRYYKESDGAGWLVAETATYPPISTGTYGYTVRGKLHEAVRPLV
jgi:SOS-response transcriptional repressor LexA